MFDQIGDPSLSEGLGRRFMTPGGAVAPSLAPEIMPVVVLENDRPEYRVLEGGGIFARGVSVPAGGAGNRSGVLVYPTSPDTLVVIERIDWLVGSGQLRLNIMNFGPPPATLPFGTVVRGTTRDTRQGTVGSPRTSNAAVWTDNTAAAISPSSNLWIGAASGSMNAAIVLAPYTALYAFPDADNVAITYFSAFWRERKLNPSER